MIFDNLRSPSAHRRAFTLIELMVVIGIIAIMLVALVPAVNSLSKASGRKAAIGSLIGTVEQARVNAIKTGQATYVVFPTFTAGSQAVLDRYDHKSFAIFQDDPAGPKQLTTWKTLPTGVCLRAKVASNQALDNLPDATSSTPPLVFSFSPEATATPLFHYIKFNSNGEIESPPSFPNKVTLAVFEGRVETGNEVVTGPKDASGEPAAREAITIAHLTGRAERVP